MPHASAAPLLALALLLPLPADETLAPLPPRAAAAIETIDGGDAVAYVAYLASDALEGRNAGTRGNTMAAEWIAAFFSEMGIRGGAPGGGYLQEFQFPASGVKGKVRTANVVAIWDGSDARLRDEAVVLGAHFDHVGRKGQRPAAPRLGRASRDDVIWNGADDNASGTAAVLEVAQAFALAQVRVRRSVVFVLFSAEEHGLHGSLHYVEDPAVPLERTSAMINLDMVGRNPGKPVYAFGLESDEDGFLEACLERAGRRLGGLEFRSGAGALGGSDHSPFLKKGIPAVFLFAGFHRDYHRVSDEVEEISGERMQSVARAAFLLVWEAANREERLAFDPHFAGKIV